MVIAAATATPAPGNSAAGPAAAAPAAGKALSSVSGSEKVSDFIRTQLHHYASVAPLLKKVWHW